MFSSTTSTSTTTLSLNNNMSPFPQYCFSLLSSSSSPPLDYNNHNLSQTQSQVQLPLSDRDDHIFFHQHNHHESAAIFSFHNNNINIPEMTQISFGPSDTNNVIGSSFYSKQEDNQVPMINDGDVSNEVPILGRKKKPAASKKDRHSKIHTAQGLRDRRVRLSIEIAREFFDLHDTLGFDKASKTLEWLLRKSNKAIVELSRSGSKSFSSGATNCQSEIDQVVSTEDDLDQTLDQPAVPAPMSKASAMKESRAKARARARERTREKKKCNNSPSSSGDGTKRIEKCQNSGSQILGQLMEANYQLVRDCSSDGQHRIAMRQDRDKSDETLTMKKLKFTDWIGNSSTTSQNQQSQVFRTMPFAETSNVTSFFPQNCDVNCTVSPWSSFALRT